MRFKLLFLMLTAVLSFSLPTFAQEVRLVYFYPKDRYPGGDPTFNEQQNVNQQLDDLINRVQKLFANEMNRLGFNQSDGTGKTFEFEKENGTAKVHHFRGEENNNSYLNNNGIDPQKIRDEIINSEGYLASGMSSYVYLIATDLNTPSNDFICGQGTYQIEPPRWRFWEETIDIPWAVIDLTPSCINSGSPVDPTKLLTWLTAHELGHAFGLQHDFSRSAQSYKYIMSYGRNPHPDGPFSSPGELSLCAAKWLNASRFFNLNPNSPVDREAEIALSSISEPSNRMYRLKFVLTDADGLRAAQFFLSGGIVLFGCDDSLLNGQQGPVEIEFTTPQLSQSDYDKVEDEIRVQVIDSYGYIIRTKFSLLQPTPVNSIADQTLEVGTTSPSLDVSDYFHDPDNYRSSYSAHSDNTQVATVRMSPAGSNLIVTAQGPGSTVVTVTASAGGFKAIQRFTVTVLANITICQVGDVLAPGESCTYPDTDTKFSVDDNGTGRFLFFSSGNSLNIRDTQISNVSYTLVAEKLASGSWEIKDIGGTPAPPPTTNNAPVFTEGVSTTRSVAENTAAGINIGTPVAATDTDGDTLTYSLGGTDASSFSIDSTSGQLRTRAALDYSVKNAYTLTITVSDGRLTDTITVTIRVTGAQNRPPVAINTIPAQTLTVGASSTPLDLSTYFQDPDNGTLNYSAVSNNSAVATGQSVGSQLTIWAWGIGTTTVTITAANSAGLSATQTITVTVTASPVQNQGPEPVGTIAHQLLLVDASPITVDVAQYFSPNNDLNYEVSSNPTGFVTASVSGSQVTIAPQQIGNTTIIVKASDRNDSSLYAIQTIPVLVYTNRATIVRPPDPTFTPPGGSNPRAEGLREGVSVITQNLDIPLRVREGAGINYDIIEHIGNGLTGIITDGPGQANGFTWWKIEWDSVNLEGWSAEFVGEQVLFRRPPDLEIRDFNVDDNEVGIGEEIELEVEIYNNGPGESAKTEVTFYYHSKSKRHSNHKEVLNANNLRGGWTLSVPALSEDEETTLTLREDAPMEPDKYYFGAILTPNVHTTDYVQDIDLDDFIGNHFAREAEVQVISSPDFIVESISVNKATVDPGEGFRLSATVLNQGIGEPEDRPTLVYRRSSDARITRSDSREGEDSVSTLDTDETDDERIDLTAPSTPGVYYYGACIEDVRNESDRNNNCSGAVAITVRAPDIVSPPIAGGDCQVGTLLAAGESCTYPGTDTEFSVNSNGNGQFLFFSSGNNLNIRNTEIRGVSYTLVAEKLESGSWEIQELGVSVEPPVPSGNAPMFTEGDTTIRTVAENTAAGIAIGTPITATDADGDTLTYSLSGINASSFSIDSATGQLQTYAALDYETTSSYAVTISVSDGNGGSSSITVTISVTDVPDTGTPPIAEGVCQVGDVLAAGESCIYPGTETEFSVNNSGLGQFLFFSSGNNLNIRNTEIRGVSYTLVAEKLESGSWQIQDLGEVETVPVPADWMPDANLRAAVRETLGLEPSEALTQQAMQELTSLRYIGPELNDNQKIRYLTGLEYATNLRHLDLYAHLISDIRPLERLLKLTSLWLAGNQIADIRPLTSLPLTELDLGGNPISDFTPLSQLTGLTRLDFWGNGLGDENLHLVTGLTSLTQLDLRNNQISDVSSLEDLMSLETLKLSGNPITDYAPLRRLKEKNPNLQIDIDITNTPTPEPDTIVEFPDATLANKVRLALNLSPGADIPMEQLEKLTHLDASVYGMEDETQDEFENRLIRNLTGLEFATQLERLELVNHRITDLTPLTGLINLEFLDLTGIGITDISPLKRLTSLTTIYFTDSRISDFTPLANLRNLTSLSLFASQIDNNDLTSLGTLLANLTSLTQLYLGHNQIKDISAVENLTNLTVLGLSYNSLSDISPLENLTNLEWLGLRDNSLSDISPLEHLTNLEWLDLRDNSLSDILPLEHLTSLVKLHLSGNPISDYGPLRRLQAKTTQTISIDVDITIDINRVPVAVSTIAAQALTVGGASVSVDVSTNFNDPDDDLTYTASSSSTSVATVSVSDAVVTIVPVAAGSATITVIASDGTLTATQTISVNVAAAPSANPVPVKRTVRLIYFLPNDRPFRPEVVQKMKVEIRNIQTFFAEQMQAHGHGNKTFRIETDAQGEPIVHRVDGQYPNSRYYADGNYHEEIRQKFDLRDENVYFIVWDNGTNLIRGAGGWGGDSRNSNGEYSGTVEVTGEFDFYLAAHELGHAFGLDHDFRDGNIMGGGGNALSACAAESLTVHSYFNPGIPLGNTSSSTIQLTSPRTYPAGTKSIPIQLKVSDPDGLHQVLLNANAALRACRGLTGKKETIVEFNYDGIIPSQPTHTIHVSVVDTNGDRTEEGFTLSEISPHHIATLETDTILISSVAFSPDGAILAAGTGTEANAVLWDVATQTNIATLPGGFSVAFSPDGATLAVGDTLWDVTTRTRIATFDNTVSVQSVAFSPDGTTLALGTSDGKVRLWDVATQTNIATLEAHTVGQVQPYVFSVAFSPDGAMLASGGWDGTAKLWDVASRTKIATLPHGSFGSPWVASVAFSPDGTTLASAQGNSIVGVVRLWDVATKREITTLEHRFDVTSVAFSPNGTILASGERDGTVKLWDVVTGTKIATLAHPSEVYSVSISPDGTMLASGTWDGTVELWDISSYTTPITLPASPMWNINRNRAMSIQDLVLVASSFGEISGESSVDVNKDGVVNIVDLVLVASALQDAVVPAVYLQTQQSLTAADVQQWLMQAQQLPFTNSRLQRGIHFLADLLAMLTPKETALFVNYPNPFNPETWIPYQLANPAEVTVTVYNVQGVVVRQLMLGHKSAGFYHNRARAAHWDGKNAFGEKVASGVYFYTLTAGDFTATRKLLIRK